jgi:arginine decarboxylase-like protein
MGYEAPDLHRWLQETIREAGNGDRLSPEEAERLTALYDAELVGYTYLEEVG